LMSAVMPVNRSFIADPAHLAENVDAARLGKRCF
jgi:hypothetical protein